MLDVGNISESVKAWRAKFGLSRESFAKHTNLSPGAIWRIEAKGQLKAGELEKLEAAWDREPSSELGRSTPRALKPLITKPMGTIVDPTIIDPEAIAQEMTLLGVTNPPPPPVTSVAPVVELPQLPGLLTISPTQMSDQDGYRRVSNSEVQTFKRCRRKWWFAYFRKLRPKNEDPTGARSIGVDLHEALRYHYVADASQRVNVKDALEAVIARNRAALIKKYEIDGELVPLSIETQFKTEADLMRIIIEGYLEWLAETGADSEYEITGSEVYLEADLPGFDKVKIIGRLDARVRRISDGLRLFIDHKSVGNFQQLTRVLHLNEQMLWYIVLEMLQADPEPVAGALYNMMRRVKRGANAKPPFYERIEVHHNKHEIESFIKRITGVIEDIRQAEIDLASGNFDHRQIVYPTPTGNCPWDCAFFQVCGMTDDGSYAEGMIKNFFTEGDPLDYYVDPASPLS